jgi:hypothetical protein
VITDVPHFTTTREEVRRREREGEGSLALTALLALLMPEITEITEITRKGAQGVGGESLGDQRERGLGWWAMET